MSDDELDELYSVKPDGFTALRRQLADVARQRGDAAAAKRIAAARKPTTAAWIVNLLAVQSKDVRQRLGELGDRLRNAHAAMDGERIRKLSAEQRHTVDELVRAALQSAGVKNPSAAIREDVTATLHAAIADSEVTAQLGRLSKVQRWSGFGDFGEAVPVSTTSRRPAAKPPNTADSDRRRDELKTQLAQGKQELGAARRQREKTRRELKHAQRDLEAATKTRDAAEQADRDAAASVEKAQAQLRRQR
jgi:hypothetical protein